MSAVDPAIWRDDADRVPVTRALLVDESPSGMVAEALAAQAASLPAVEGHEVAVSGE